jgi:TonB family protein|tara:strand:+ start:211 stop:528 length:318 start_codon:yes stop_codon:yes gene_type:complete
MGKLLSCLLLLGTLVAEDNSLPKEIVPFELYAHELPIIHNVYEGRVLVSFIIDEEGNVSKAEIVDSFNVALNEVVLDKVRQTKYKPAVQNGRAVRVKYQLPIVFK